MDAKKHDQRGQKEAGEGDIIVAEGQGRFKGREHLQQQCWIMLRGANAETQQWL